VKLYQKILFSNNEVYLRIIGNKTLWRGKIVKMSGLEVPPPGFGLRTVILTSPVILIWPKGTIASRVFEAK
jgi:hypothetical protein